VGLFYEHGAGPGPHIQTVFDGNMAKQPERQPQEETAPHRKQQEQHDYRGDDQTRVTGTARLPLHRVP